MDAEMFRKSLPGGGDFFVKYGPDHGSIPQ